MVDHAPVQIKSLDENEHRTHMIEVAGPAALLVSKVLKVAERNKGTQRQQDDKDAFDIDYHHGNGQQEIFYDRSEY